MKEDEQQFQQPEGSYQLPATLMRELEDNNQLIKTLTDHSSFLSVIRQEMRGEQLFTDEQGANSWQQVDKPMFVRLNKENKPIKVRNPKTGKEEYLPNDEAISAMLNVLKSCGLNQITPLTIITENEIRDDLLEMESKIAMLLCIKRKEWGIDKAEYPITIGNLKVLIKDARYKAKDGAGLRALRTITSRTEQILSNRPAEQGGFNPLR